MEFVPWLNVWWEFEVGEVNDNIVWKMVVLLVIWSNWVILVDYFNDCSNGPIVRPPHGRIFQFLKATRAPMHKSVWLL